MKKTVLIYGLIAGGIEVLMFFITMPLFKNGALSMNSSEVIGYTTMFIALSMIFFGVKSYRDNHLHGIITFGKAFQAGILIALVAGLLYAVGWELNLKFVSPDFLETYTTAAIKKAHDRGATAAELQKITDQMKSLEGIYANPFLRFGITFMEIFPVGLLISLVSAGILRKKAKETAV